MAGDCFRGAGTGSVTQAVDIDGEGRLFPSTFHSNISFEDTRLVTEIAEELRVPASVRRRLDLGDFRLGVIGVNDDTMGELVPSGSVVVIDKSLDTVEMGGWKSIRERPITVEILAAKRDLSRSFLTVLGKSECRERTANP